LKIDYFDLGNERFYNLFNKRELSNPIYGYFTTNESLFTGVIYNRH